MVTNWDASKRENLAQISFNEFTQSTYWVSITDLILKMWVSSDI